MQTSPPVPPPGDLDQTTLCDIRLVPHLATGRNIHVVFDSGLLPPLYEIMTSSTKPEEHKVSHQRRTEPRPQVTWTANQVKFGLCGLRDMQADRQTNRQTDTLITILSTPYQRQSNNSFKMYYKRHIRPQATVLTCICYSNYLIWSINYSLLAYVACISPNHS